MQPGVSVIHGPGEVQGLPFSSAVRVGDLLFLSGQIGNVPGTRQLADGGIAGQTRQVLENIKAVYATYFPKDPPARSTVAASGLAGGARVEIECIATAG